MKPKQNLLERITVNPTIFGGKPIIKNRRLAVEHILGRLSGVDSEDTTYFFSLDKKRRYSSLSCLSAAIYVEKKYYEYKK